MSRKRWFLRLSTSRRTATKNQEVAISKLIREINTRKFHGTDEFQDSHLAISPELTAKERNT
ncbi:hypothetical protein, partial [Chroococcidiopsis cubana]|uniref:hypothetical protein n=1 Tax=Chroococcidiopsis cubana TaxID=171392 RepID=UPI001C625C59